MAAKNGSSYTASLACFLVPQGIRQVAPNFAQAAQLNEFLDELPEVPRDKVCVDDSDGYQAPPGKS